MTNEEMENAITDVIAKAEAELGLHRITFDKDEVYAYRHPAFDTIHYGWNGGTYGFCILQGIWYDEGDQRNQRWHTGNPG